MMFDAYKYRAVIWDLGGVIIRTDDPTPRTNLAVRLGLTRQQLEQLAFDSETARQAELGEIPAEEHWQQLGSNLGVGTQELNAFQNAFWGGDRLDDPLMNFIRAMRPDFKTELLSNAWSDARQRLAQCWHIEDAFDEIILSAEVGLTKPDPRIYSLAIEKLGVEPSEVVLIDDTPENLAGAQSAGLTTIQFYSPAQVGSELLDLLKETH